jgi:hypothetical protein
MNFTEKTIRLSGYVYNREAVSRAIGVFSGHCTVLFAEIEGDVTVTVEPVAGALPTITEEFLNYALNLSIEQELTEA